MSEPTRDERRRYARHLTLPQVGEQGQRRLAEGSVLLVGAGGLGSPVALYLAAAGVGRLGLVDGDAVELTNLQRQVLYGEATLGARKTAAAAARLADLNPLVTLEPHDARLTSANALELVGRYDVVVDATDNFPTRYLLSDACVLAQKPLVHGSIYRFEGQVTVFDARRGPCYRCLFPEPPPPALAPSCADGGVLGVLPGVVGTLQANEVLKLLLGIGEELVGRLLTFDALTSSFSTYRLAKDPACPRCGVEPKLEGLVDYEAFCAGPAHARDLEIEPVAAAARLRRGEVALLDVREPFEWRLCRLEGATLVPLGELERRLGELSPSRPLVVYCHHGRRSLTAVDILRRAGFAQAYNLTGGIDAWSVEVDPSVPRY